MREIKLVVVKDKNDALSLWIEEAGVKHRCGYSLAENKNHADFYRRVARHIPDSHTKGDAVTYIDVEN